MLIEASLILTEGIVREPADVDMGLILGLGFPPQHGGLLRWADTAGMAGQDSRTFEQVRSVTRQTLFSRRNR